MIDAEKLIAQGYRKTSNKYRIISRVDRPDWIEYIYKTVFYGRRAAIADAVKTYYDGMPIDDFGFSKKTVLMEARSVADYYRRCCSQDKIEGVPAEVFKKIPTSCHDGTGFCPK